MKDATIKINHGLMECTCVGFSPDGKADPECDDCNGKGVADYTALFWKEVEKTVTL